jgi:hypothetical protein
MSRNLELRDDDNNYSLWQTPTYITYMCLTPKNDSTENILERYLYWVESHTEGVWKDRDAYYDMIEAVREHIKKVKAWLERHPNAKFYSS